MFKNFWSAFIPENVISALFLSLFEHCTNFPFYYVAVFRPATVPSWFGCAHKSPLLLFILWKNSIIRFFWAGSHSAALLTVEKVVFSVLLSSVTASSNCYCYICREYRLDCSRKFWSFKQLHLVGHHKVFKDLKQ